MTYCFSPSQKTDLKVAKYDLGLHFNSLKVRDCSYFYRGLKSRACVCCMSVRVLQYCNTRVLQYCIARTNDSLGACDAVGRHRCGPGCANCVRCGGVASAARSTQGRPTLVLWMALPLSHTSSRHVASRARSSFSLEQLLRACRC